jgi:hypothetical protein
VSLELLGSKTGDVPNAIGPVARLAPSPPKINKPMNLQAVTKEQKPPSHQNSEAGGAGLLIG